MPIIEEEESIDHDYDPHTIIWFHDLHCSFEIVIPNKKENEKQPLVSLKAASCAEKSLFSIFTAVKEIIMTLVKPAVTPPGLCNLGNTCYLNSAIQMLFSLQTGFVEDLLSAPTSGKLHAALKDVGTKLRNDRDENSTQVVDPSPLKSAIDELTERFVGYRQQDSHEFFMALLDLLNDEMEADKKKDDEADTEIVDVRNEISDAKKEESKEEVTDTIMEEVKEDVKENDEETKKADGANDEESSSDEPKSEAQAPLKKIISFTELDPNTISNLLHGEDSDDNPSWTHIQPSQPMTLVGGRSCCATSPTVAITSLDDVLPRKRSFDLTVVKETDTEEPESDEVCEIETHGPSEVPHKEEDCEHSCDTDDWEIVTKPLEEGEEEEEHHRTPVNKHFSAEVRVTLKCDSCSYTRTKVELHRHISIEVNNTSNTVHQGLSQFFQPEKRELRCEKCFCETATQSMELVELPKCLLIHFKRFIVEMSPEFYVTFRKNQAEVEFEDKVEMDDYCEGDNLARAYKLRSSVHHIGNTASCGHYTADALVPNEEKRDTWMRFNDSHVNPITETQAMGVNAQKNAYMVLYELMPEV